MSGKKLKDDLKKLRKKIGVAQLKRELAWAGLGLSTSEKLAKGTYDSEPGEKVANGIMSVLMKFKEAKAS